jgi:dCTP deaminase
MESRDIRISNFSDDLEPASYDLRVGEEAVTQKGMVDIEKEKYVKIPRGATMVIYSHERIQLSTKIAGRYGLRSHFARKGLVLLSGPQIDPGFEGTLSVTVFNAGSSEVVLSYLEKLATIEFSLLRTPASKAYSGRYQGQIRIPSEEVELITREYKSFSEIEDALSSTQEGVDNIKNFNYVVVFGIVVGAVLVILERLLSR